MGAHAVASDAPEVAPDVSGFAVHPNAAFPVVSVASFVVVDDFLVFAVDGDCAFAQLDAEDSALIGCGHFAFPVAEDAEFLRHQEVSNVCRHIVAILRGGDVVGRLRAFVHGVGTLDR